MAAPSRLTLEAVAYQFVAPLGEGPRLALIRTLLRNYCAWGLFNEPLHIYESI